ncbi:MAG: hypothetical protein AB7K09_15635 [Planctomycetota bacterium]
MPAVPFDTTGLYLNPATNQLHDVQTGRPVYQLHPSGWVYDLERRFAFNPAIGWAVDPALGIAVNMQTGQRFNMHTGAPLDVAPSPSPAPPAAPPQTAQPAAALAPSPLAPVRPAPPSPAQVASVVGQLCPTPSGWPWEVAPMPQAALDVHSEATRQELLARLLGTDAAKRAASGKETQQTVVGVLSAATGFIPAVGGLLTGIASTIISGILELFGGKPACVNPSDACGEENTRADGRAAGRAAACCMPRFSGLGVVVMANVMGRGQARRSPGTSLLVPVSRGDLTRTDGAAVDRRTVENPGLNVPLQILSSPAATVMNDQKVQGWTGFAVPPLTDDTWVAVPWDLAADRPWPLRNGRQLGITIQQAMSLAFDREYRGVSPKPGYKVWRWRTYRDHLRTGRYSIVPVVQYETPHYWPADWDEAAAGDYDLTGSGAGYGELVPRLTMEQRKVNQLTIPEGWSVMLYAGRDFAGESRLYGPGNHDLVEDWVHPHGVEWPGSMRVRGWWTLADSRHVAALRAQEPGWLTSDWPEAPSREAAIAIVLQDPCRPPSPASHEIPVPHDRASFWGPGWQERLAALQQGTAGASAALPAARSQQPENQNPYAGRTVVYR